MRFVFTAPFMRDYHKLSLDIQKLFDKQLELLLSNFRHPGLQARIVDK